MGHLVKHHGVELPGAFSPLFAGLAEADSRGADADFLDIERYQDQYDDSDHHGEQDRPQGIILFKPRDTHEPLQQ